MTSPAIDPSLGFIDVDLLKKQTKRPTESHEANKTTDQEKKTKKEEKEKKKANLRNTSDSCEQREKSSERDKQRNKEYLVKVQDGVTQWMNE